VAEQDDRVQDGARICTGPRWDALIESLEQAESALAAPLSDEELEHGWTESLREAMLESVARNRQGLTANPARAELFERWIDGEELDGSVDDARWDATLGPDLVAENLLNAERVLLETIQLADTLRDPVSDADRDHGFTEDVRLALLGCLGQIQRRLERGDFLEAEDIDAWNGLLEGAGFRRNPAIAPGGNSGSYRSGAEVGQISEFPPGRCWERVCIYDAPLARLAGSDVE
jgi:hypothetical protein